MIYKILSFLAYYKLQKATNETVFYFIIFVNFCSPEGTTKLCTFSAL